MHPFAAREKSMVNTRRVARFAAGLLLVTAPLAASHATASTNEGTFQAAAAATPTCDLPESDAEALVILNYYYPNRYLWDDAHLTVAVQAAPNVSPEQVAAARRAIQTWTATLQECFDGQITLTDVTGAKRRTADIVVHYVPRAGGVVFGGIAICGAGGCNNVIVRSDLPPSSGRDPYSPEYLYFVTLHELGHALGLGHATNLLESTDLMGYGWSINDVEPVLSQCDVDALAYLFSGVLEGTAPNPGPSDLPVIFDCA
jgi:hypothetical protein